MSRIQPFFRIVVERIRAEVGVGTKLHGQGAFQSPATCGVAPRTTSHGIRAEAASALGDEIPIRLVVVEQEQVDLPTSREPCEPLTGEKLAETGLTISAAEPGAVQPSDGSA